jgi:hypothetical protein
MAAKSNPDGPRRNSQPGEQGFDGEGRTELDVVLAEMKRLAEQVAAAWTSPKSGVELVDEQRR